MRAAAEVDDRQTGRVTVERDRRVSALSGRLIRLRTAAGLDQDELAHAAGLDQAAYRSVEAGDVAGLTYLDLLGIADALAVPAAAVLADPDAGQGRRPAPAESG